MLRVSAFLFILTAALSVGLIIHFSDIRNEARYVGVDVCGSCHATTSSRLVYQDWKDGPHERAYASLESEQSQRYLQEKELTVTSCLTCHTTLGREGASDFERSLNASGVGCERCHGPGSEYVQTAVMTNPARMIEAGGSPGDLKDCYGCHADNPSAREWACPFQEYPFEAEAAWAEIGHNRQDEEDQDSVRSVSDSLNEKIR